MKIAYVLMTYPTGSEAHTCIDVRLLKEAGHDIEVLSFTGETEETAKLTSDRRLENVPAFRAPKLPGKGIFGYLMQAVGIALKERNPKYLAGAVKYAPLAARLAKVIDERGYDVVNLYWGHIPSLVGILAKRANPKRVVTTSLRAYDMTMKMNMSRIMLQEADWTFTQAHANVPTIEELGGKRDKITVSFDGVDVENFDRTLGEPVQRDGKTILAAGRVIPEKGFDLMLKAFAAAREKVPDLKFRLAGDGPQMEEIKALANSLGVGDAVTYLGFISQAQLYREMRGCGIFMLLSQKDSERLPNVVKEAAIAGAPVITSDTVGIREIVLNDDHGYVVPMADWQQAYEAILKIVTDPEHAETISRTAEAYVREHFDVRNTQAKYLKVWEDLLTKRGK